MSHHVMTTTSRLIRPQRVLRLPHVWLQSLLVVVALLMMACAAPKRTATVTQLTYARSDLKSELTKFEDYDKHLRYQDKARRGYLKARNIGLKALEKQHPGFRAALQNNPAQAVLQLDKEELDLTFWTGAAWMAAISISIDKAELLAELPQATALLERVLVLEPDYDSGGLQEIFMALNMSRPEALGGGLNRALANYERALSLSGGKRASVFVGYATAIAVKQQDRKAFEAALARALAINPKAQDEGRLANKLAQKKARYLLRHVEELFEDDVLMEEADPASAPTP